jgi:hypothetical protein
VIGQMRGRVGLEGGSNDKLDYCHVTCQHVAYGWVDKMKMSYEYLLRCIWSSRGESEQCLGPFRFL